jgi:quercetin dioxygenase-like cupin family protein
MITARTGTLVPPGAGATIELGLGRPTIKVGPSLNAQIGLVESELPPGGGFSIPHWHEDLYEVFYVLEGEIDYLLDRVWRRAPAGSTVFIPAGTVHAFRNATSRPARQLVASPPHAIEMLTELGGHPREQWEAIHERYRSYYAHDHPALGLGARQP